ncbi:autocrine proliferation repressor protein A-like isoform X3 [Physella acuta]|uniref:autocrine proliferation repressor protein A-like isoform X1 n=1 Tax=Physella acuta TaxID=109671 RepID=UPI0027DD6AE3|nr:autocrine proliferation repressor protein A-like isoform X1 [Physella acuta]XP_059147466.1 autocrine proliferation repressor protein A-like isoform X2 [Physella acuta]XP_059147468.1 autocrine proliferation repressor protein A-like isoform X3 [Physella acuta]
MKLASLLVVAAIVLATSATPLDDYVNTFDPHYTYRFLKKIDGPNYSLHILNMTSQKWLTEQVLTRPIWWHYLSVIIPKDIVYRDTAFLWIDGGGNNDGIPTEKDEFVAGITAFSVATGAIAATIKQIPNQPITFFADPTKKSRSEDAVIAWTWKTFLANGSNPEVLLRLPMTKAVVRGFDTMASYSKIEAGVDLTKYVVGGASKRGWTTWTTAAVDKRVVGMVPVVMDLLNTQKNLHHHYRSLGGWTFAFGDYYTLNVTRDLDSPNMPKMLAVIDPLTYKDRYTFPKMIVSTSGDEFFLPDDSHYYFDQLIGPKYLRITPNAEHSLIGHFLSTVLAMQAFFLNIVENVPYPAVNWTLSQNSTAGSIEVHTSVPPTQVTVFHAKTLDGKRRDFRLVIADPNTGKALVHPVLWFSRSATQVSPTHYIGEVLKPQVGWAAFFIQLHFEGVKGSTLEFTTEMNIVPDIFPYSDCSGEACHGSLV